uniref:WRKY domain-containing protein n=1 Tax=Brassica campestris TaxID=3711 RepID=A0A3P5YBE1_BRACM|nr:unnamed protein product [Brassica rapa]
MSDYGDGNFMDMVSSRWAPPPSTSLSDNGLNPISDIFLQTNQSKQRPGLVDRVAARIGRNIPPIRTDNLSPCAVVFKDPKTVPFGIEISPGLSPSVMLQSRSQLINPYSFPNDEPPETVENSGDDHAKTMIFNKDVPYQPMHFDLPPQEGSLIPSHFDPIGAPLVASFESEVADDTDTKLMSLDDESESQDEEESNEDEDTDDPSKLGRKRRIDEEEDDDIADEHEVKPSSPKRRKYDEVSNMMTALRASNNPRVRLRMETEEAQPNDGHRWRKYGQKIVKGNPNPRSYYKCSHKGCIMKKHVERAADDLRMLLVTYYGKHGHAAPLARSSSSSGPKNLYRSSVPARLGRPPFSSSSAAQDMRSFPYPSASAPRDMKRFGYPSALAPQAMRPFPSSLNPGVDMTHLYKTGLSKLPSLPVNQNHGFMDQNAEPWVNQNHGFMGQNAEPQVNQNHGFMAQNAEPWVNQNHGFMGQNAEPRVNQNHGFMSQNAEPRNDEPWINQNHGFMGQNAEPWVNQNHGFMGQNAEPRVNQNHGFMGQNVEPQVNQNHGFMGQNVEPQVNQNHGFMGQNDEPWLNQNHGFMGQNDEPWLNQNHGLMDQNDEPWVNQNHGFMGQNDEPWLNQNYGFMGQNDEPKTDHVIPDGTEVYKGLRERMLANLGVKR